MDGKRKIVIRPKYGENLNVSGIYVLWFKGCFYIGSSKNIHKRVRQHERAINSKINGGKIFGYLLISELLAKDKRVKNVWVQVLIMCKPDLALKLERLLLQYHVFNYDKCLNQAFCDSATIRYMERFKKFYIKTYSHVFKY